jgi:glycosyltransferase involved in cell wall biosynthesis
MPEISICIPVYNFVIEPLIAKLSTEISAKSISAEIIVIDDASDLHYRPINHLIVKEYPVNYIQLEKNIGRSAIRNLFLTYAKSPLLLFLDCDVMPASNEFISEYLLLENQKAVVCGGIKYASEPPSRKNKLHWKYGCIRESQTAIKRNKYPYRYFFASNFLIHKEILKAIRFNEELRGYGYEDTLYGIELERKSIELKHIDNPVEHLKLDSGEEFVLKTENALKNLYSLYNSKQYSLEKFIKIVRANNISRMLGLTTPASFIYDRFGKTTIRRKLIDGNCNLRLLDLYKLLFFIAFQKKNNATPYLY